MVDFLNEGGSFSSTYSNEVLSNLLSWNKGNVLACVPVQGLSMLSVYVRLSQVAACDNNSINKDESSSHFVNPQTCQVQFTVLD